MLRKPGRGCAAGALAATAGGARRTAGRRPAYSFGLRYEQGGRAERPEQATAPPHRRPPAKSSESGRRCAGGGPLARGVDSLWQRRRSQRMREASGCAWMRRLAVPPSGRYSGVGSLGRGAGVQRKPGRRCAAGALAVPAGARPADGRPTASACAISRAVGPSRLWHCSTARRPAKSSESCRRCAGGSPLARGVGLSWQPMAAAERRRI